MLSTVSPEHGSEKLERRVVRFQNVSLHFTSKGLEPLVHAQNNRAGTEALDLAGHSECFSFVFGGEHRERRVCPTLTAEVEHSDINVLGFVCPRD